MIDAFLDTNVLLRHLLQDHSEHGPRATTYLKRIERGEIEVLISEIVVFEVVFTLQRQFKVTRDTIRALIVPLIELPGIILPGKRRMLEVFDRYVESGLSFADAYHVVLMQHLAVSRIVTFDTDFDRIPGVQRIQP